MGKNIHSIFLDLFILSLEEVSVFFSFELSETQPVDSKFLNLSVYLFNHYISEESLFRLPIWVKKVQVYSERHVHTSLFTKLKIVF